jgi:dipeptidyl aminopeptidase/acylaminoacyl peptidase
MTWRGSRCVLANQHMARGRFSFHGLALIPGIFLGTFLGCVTQPQFQRSGYDTKTDAQGLTSRYSWSSITPFVKEVTVYSERDQAEQRAMFYDSGSDHEKPLVVVLHSWSWDYSQSVNLPYAVWAQRNDWVFISPNFRGSFHDSTALSELAQADIVDAVEYARAHARVDPDRIYLAGYSGGASLALLVATRYKGKFAAVVAWSPVFDLNLWFSDRRIRGRQYMYDLMRICGGVPVPDSVAYEECRSRSPSTYWSRKQLGATRVYIATGLYDDFVAPAQTLSAYNSLVQINRQLSPELLEIQSPTPDLELIDPAEETYYSQAGRPLILARDENRISLRVYNGEHDIIYDAGLYWMSRH